MRSETMYSQLNFDLSSAIDLSPVAGRAVEICGNFEVGASTFGFNVFKSATGEGKIYYNPSSGEIIADFSGLNRLVNDNNVYNGIYSCPLPVRPAEGESLKINIFLDHSIVDIFVNDRYATSIRVFPTDADANGIEAYSDSTTRVTDLKAWVLDSHNSGVATISQGNTNSEIYNLHGMKIDSASQINGIYISNGKKILGHN